MLEQERRSQILKFSQLFHWNQDQEANYVRRMTSHLINSKDFDKDFILWSDKNWNHFIVSSLQYAQDNIPSTEVKNFLNWLAEEPQEETSVVLWHQIMKVSEHTVCRSLNLSAGAFRFRLSRGLTSLGKKI